MTNLQKEVQTKLAAGLLYLVILRFLSTEPMHGYQVIARMRRMFGVYFGTSTIYPLLDVLEKKGYVYSEWTMTSERHRKIYKLTAEGHSMLNFTENSPNLMFQKINTRGAVKAEAAASGASLPFHNISSFIAILAK